MGLVGQATEQIGLVVVKQFVMKVKHLAKISLKRFAYDEHVLPLF